MSCNKEVEEVGIKLSHNKIKEIISKCKMCNSYEIKTEMKKGFVHTRKVREIVFGYILGVTK